MTGSPRRVLSVCLLLLAGGRAARAADAADDAPVDAAFVLYQDELLGRESGVYERGDSVFVLVRVPVEPGTRLRAKGRALLEFAALLREWAFERTRRDRGAEPRRPAAVSRMAAFNDEASPGWRVPPWRIAVAGRQFPSREIGGFLHEGQVYDRDALLAAIPGSYRSHPSDEAVAEAFAALGGAAFRRDPAAFAAWCGFSEYATLADRDVPAPPDPGSWKESAVRLREEGRPADAVPLLLDALAAAPDDADAIAEIALCREALGRPSPARAAALVAFAAAPDETIREKVEPLLTKGTR